MHQAELLYNHLRHLLLSGMFLLAAWQLSIAQGSFKPNYYQYDATVLGTNTVYRLLEDPYGFIWLMSNKGILVFNGKTFESIKIPGSEQEIVNFCRYKNIVYASSYAGQLYAIDMLTLVVKEIPLPKSVTNEATPFMIMNTVDNLLYLSKAEGAFIIIDAERNNKLALISTNVYFLRYLLHKDLAQIDLRLNDGWKKFWKDKIYAKNEIYDIYNNKLKVFFLPVKKIKNYR
ncbi:hypothetical protein [Niabella hibiscisoli]|uniref:hypothetical protein n=1 Tax=Niabella hibiscisoli TaxID=1825928 RepID=UPI001F100C1A|nr:hypothetical protein [Niabella hibiscisoli]MCH5718326.1 hypothetical protein [Niabella hibiscisoli]